MNKELMFSTGNDETGTDWDFFLELNREFDFGCDVAATRLNAKVTPYFGPDHSDPARRDCLTVDWPTHKPNWMNPPYSDPEYACKKKCKKKRCEKRGYCIDMYRPGCTDFVRKAVEQQKKGVTTVALLAARTDTEWFHKYIWNAKSHRARRGIRVRLLKGRLKFEGHKNSAPFPSMLVIFKPYGRRTE